MADPEPIKSTSPDTFLRQHKATGVDASTEETGKLPIKSVGDLDTLYQKKESTTVSPPIDDPRETTD